MRMNTSHQSFSSKLVLIVVSLGFVKVQKKIHGREIMRDIIEAKVLSKDWSFSEISNLAETIETLSSQIYSEMNVIERFQMIRELKINDSFIGMTFEDAFREMVILTLRSEIAGVIREMLNNATVNFGGNKNEVSERSVGGESSKKRPSVSKKNSEE